MSLINERLPLKNLLLISSGIYAAQGVIGGMTFNSFPAILRANQASHEMIGLFFLAMLPWAFKFLWAPFIETYRIGNVQKKRSRIVLLSGACLACAIIILLALNGFHPFYLLFALAFMLAIVAATTDIACDGFIIEQLKPSDRGWGNTSQIGGAYIGYLLGAGGFLWLHAQYGWQISLYSMAFLVLFFALPLLFFKEPKSEATGSPHRQSLVDAFKRKEIIIGMIMMLLYDFGIRYAGSLIPSYMVDKGLSLKMIAFISGTVGIGAGLAGTLIGGLIVKYLGARLGLIIAVFLQVMVLSLLYWMSTLSALEVNHIAAVVVFKSFCLGFGFVGIYSFLMGLVSSKQAGVDFTIFQSLDAAVLALVSFGANYLTAHIGYTNGFALAAGVSALAFLIITFYLSKNSNFQEQPAL